MARDESTPHGGDAGRDAAPRLDPEAPPGPDIALLTIDREGDLVWSTAAAQHELAKLGALSIDEVSGRAHLTVQWTRRFWVQVRDSSRERQFRLLLPGPIPYSGFVLWRPERKDRLMLGLWPWSPRGVDPLWHEILTRVGEERVQPTGASAA